ncbi:MAG TPA: LemA family protein [Pseudomonas sp.]|nr:LemA family protein [Pseudomonas sp.]
MQAWQWIGVALAALVTGYGIWCYNRLVFNRHRVAEAWSGIDVQLKRRSSLIPNLVAALREYMAHERGTLEALTEQRSAAQRHEGDTVGERGVAEAQLGTALMRVLILAEAYPQLKADSNFLALQRTLSEVEDQIQMSRRYYNGAVRELNILVESVPSNLVARPLRFTTAEYFTLADAREGHAPTLEF